MQKKVIKISLIGCGFRKGKKISTKKNYFHITEWKKKILQIIYSNRYLGLISLLIFSSRGGGEIIIWKDNDKIIIIFE